MLIQLLERNAERFPDDTALTYGAESITHSELLSRVQRSVDGLGSLGIGAGDAVALFLDSTPAFVVSFFAIAARRAICVPLNPKCKEEELRFYFRDAGVRCVISEEHRLGLCAKATADLPKNGRPTMTAPKDLDTASLAGKREYDLNSALGDVSLDDKVTFLYSSGSTGKAKRIPRTNLQYWWEIEHTTSEMELGRTDTILCAIPLFHNYGLVNCMLAAAGTGARLILLEAPFILRRRQALELLEKERVTVFPGVPYLFRRLIESSAKADLSSLRLCLSAGTALSRHLFEGFYEKFRIPIRQHYGCSELGGISLNLDSDPRPSAESVGHAMRGIRIKIVDEGGNELPACNAGEIAVASRAMTRGYSNMDELNRIAFRGGYFFTGDLGYLDENGHLYITGRKRLLIEVAGNKVNPVEVEEVLRRHRFVREVVVASATHPESGEPISEARVIVHQPCDERDLISFCEERLANFKVPSRIKFCDEIPKGAIGTIALTMEDQAAAQLIEDLDQRVD